MGRSITKIEWNEQGYGYWESVNTDQVFLIRRTSSGYVLMEAVDGDHVLRGGPFVTAQLAKDCAETLI